jgi:hypothetical protein
MVELAGGETTERWTLHDRRRTLATGMQRLGVRFEVTEAILNHVSGSRDVQARRIAAGGMARIRFRCGHLDDPEGTDEEMRQPHSDEMPSSGSSRMPLHEQRPAVPTSFAAHV